MSGDVNTIMRAYLVNQPSLIALVGSRIYCPRVPEGVSLPSLGFFVKGGVTGRFIRTHKVASFQFDCWGSTPLIARSVYITLYDILQGIGGYYNAQIPVVIGPNTYYILSAEEETSGQDLQDSISGYFRVLASFRVRLKIG